MLYENESCLVEYSGRNGPNRGYVLDYTYIPVNHDELTRPLEACMMMGQDFKELFQAAMVMTFFSDNRRNQCTEIPYIVQ